MPTYQYTCTTCAHELEAVQSFNDAPLSICPECKGDLRKVFSSIGIVFKGTGFYRIDSRKENGKEAALPAKKDADSKKETKKTETKTSTEKAAA